MTIAEAARLGITRVRLGVWADPASYLRLDLFDGGTHGPWVHLYERGTQEAIGEPTPQDILFFQVAGHTDFVEYTGPQDPSDVRA